MNDAIEISNLIYRYAERIGLGGFDALGVLFERALITTDPAQGEGTLRTSEKDAYLLEISRYIHLNPVRVGEVSRAWEFLWSSAAAYVGQAAEPEFLAVGDVLAHFGRRQAAARRRCAEFLADGDAATAGKPWRLVEGQVLLGERAGVRDGSARGQQGDCAHGGAEKRRGKGWTGVGAAYF